VTQAPELPDEAPVLFTQVVQMIDFLTPEAAEAYPKSAAHQALVEFSQGMVKKVVAIDFEI
jgi:type IV secretory pathway VirB2 component (pilin)